MTDLTTKDPRPGSIWRHKSGRIYTVLFLTNDDGNRQEYPRTVVYMGQINGKLWSGRLDDWHRRMTEMAL
jgi:hypothetical protein